MEIMHLVASICLSICVCLFVSQSFYQNEILCIPDVQEVCHNEVFRATCADNEVIVIESAFYGRMRIGRCVKTDFGFIGCFQDVLKVKN